MNELYAEVIVNMELKDGETEEEAQERFYDVLYDGICKCNNDFHFEIYKQKIREVV